jgi:hypothetical protein
MPQVSNIRSIHRWKHTQQEEQHYFEKTLKIGFLNGLRNVLFNEDHLRIPNFSENWETNSIFV